MKYTIGLFLATLLFNVSAFADQLIVKENSWHGISYVLQVISPKHCIRVIENLSNIHKYSNGKYPTYLDKYFKKEFICVKANGTISNHGFIYQIPYSKKDKNIMCLIYSEWDGLDLIEECKNEGFTTRPIMINEKSLRDYVIMYNAK